MSSVSRPAKKRKQQQLESLLIGDLESIGKLEKLMKIENELQNANSVHPPTNLNSNQLNLSQSTRIKQKRQSEWFRDVEVMGALPATETCSYLPKFMAVPSIPMPCCVWGTHHLDIYEDIYAVAISYGRGLVVSHLVTYTKTWSSSHRHVRGAEYRGVTWHLLTKWQIWLTAVLDWEPFQKNDRSKSTELQ